MLQVRGRALFIVLHGQFRAWRRLQAGKTVVLNFHAKGELQRMTSGAGRPPLGRLLALLSLYELLCKRTETDVAFTREYTWDIKSKEW